MSCVVTKLETRESVKCFPSVASPLPTPATITLFLNLLCFDFVLIALDD